MENENVNVENQESNAIEESSTQSQIDSKAYEQVRNDMHKYKRQSIEAAQKLSEYESRLKEVEEQKLQQSESYKELWEKEKNSRLETETKLKDFSNSVVSDKKMGAIREYAIKKGLNDQFLDLLDSFDTSEVIVETTSSGNFQVNGADTWVEGLLKDRPAMFNRKVDPNINNGGTSNSQPRDKVYSASEILALQRENPQKYAEVIMKQRSQIRK